MRDSVVKQLTELGRMDLAALRNRWRALYGTEPPATYKRPYLVRRLAYRLQELAYGGLSDETRVRLRQIADENAHTRTRRSRRRGRRKPGQPVPGTRLVREWRGRRYVVTALSDGFEFDGRRFRSLSAVAKAITGAHHSGPRFFGLDSRREA